MGKICVKLQYGDAEVFDDIIIVREKLGRDQWVRATELEEPPWKPSWLIPSNPTIEEITQTKGKLLNEFDDVLVGDDVQLKAMGGNPLCIGLASDEDTKKLDSMVEKGIIVSSKGKSSEWCHPMVVVKKKSGDHQAMVPIMNSKTLDAIENPRQRGIKEQILLRYNFTCKWIPGKDMYASDALSRCLVEIPERSDLLHDGQIGWPIVCGITSDLDENNEIQDLQIEGLKSQAKQDSGYCELVEQICRVSRSSFECLFSLSYLFLIVVDSLGSDPIIDHIHEFSSDDYLVHNLIVEIF
ncbi:hypothetical protein TCAL_11414 [Tigriopus californicus]|uniref:Uncharacterized protein n=1 Tax=Tigriopus californicus TaxID=6832 RepID=A0A553P448_TIGCA|nr:hypothetical protein TCAL_11414 [Tigriopus californicus]|eukprot:TCALIF_11414-PA protein Name:"Protein of unknown function" AED:0.35 eAED:0.36 QI:0/0/0/0.6/1/1/5/0/296